MYDQKAHGAIAINGVGRKGWTYLRKGFRETLLCNECEQFLNKTYEQFFHRLWCKDGGLLPAVLSQEWYEFDIKDYAKFKLFHLSVLFRASVSSLPVFAQVRLGPHRETIRRMILDETPGREVDYPIYCMALFKNGRRKVEPFVATPYHLKINSHRSYCFGFGHCLWRYSVSNHTTELVEELYLRDSGKLYVLTEDWTKPKIVKKARDLLRSDSNNALPRESHP
jgi:hypothetical protein